MEPLPTRPLPDVKATVEAAVAATITASPDAASPGAVGSSNPARPTPALTHPPEPTPVREIVSIPTPMPEPTATPRPTLTPTPTPVPTPTPTPRPTATPRPTPTPSPTPTPTVRPTLELINTAARRSETIITSLEQQVDVTVSGFDDSPLRFKQLVRAINEIEGLLGVPYPSPRVTLRKAATLQLREGFCGTNQLDYAYRRWGQPYVIKNSSIEIRVDERCSDTYDYIAHEVAHTWFHGNDPADWIDEGLASVMAYQVVAATDPEGRITYPPITYCESYRNIRELEQAAPSRSYRNQSSGFRCNYTLGDGIFGAIREYYGDEEFNRRAAQLARQLTSDTNPAYTIDDIRQVFGGDSPAPEIINNWYDGQPEPRKYRHLNAVEWTFPPTIDGEYLHFAGRTNQPELVYDFVSGAGEYCSQFVLYDGIGDLEYIDGVRGPVPAGWRHDRVPEIITINHRISPETGEFSVTAKINDSAVADHTELSLAVRSQVTVGEGGFCKESIRYSQVPVATGKIPVEFKQAKHYHLDAVQWIIPPTISGNTLEFVGKALPGVIRLTWREGYCSQFHFYQRDESGYHYVGNLALLLPANSYWLNSVAAEVTAQRVGDDGTFEAQVRLNDNTLSQYSNLALLVTTQAEVDRSTSECGEADVLSAVDVQ